MARPLRIEYEGAWYHVMNRGANRRQIFKTDEQRQYFLSLLADTAERFNAEWHGYCLMGNHYHLLVRTPEGNLQRIMRHINGPYTQYFNRLEKRDGPLFRGRYKAILVDAQTYWTQLSRYIHRNPLEAGLVKRLDYYRWSSYPVYIGKQDCPEWLTCDYILRSLSNHHRQAHYKAYVAEETDAEIKVFYARKKQSPILGSESYIQSLKLEDANPDLPELKQVRNKPTAEQIVTAICHHLEVDPETIWISRRGRAVTSPARGMALYLCQRQGEMTLGKIAKRFGLKSYASAGSSILLFQKRLKEDKKLQRLIKGITLDLRS